MIPTQSLRRGWPQPNTRLVASATKVRSVHCSAACFASVCESQRTDHQHAARSCQERRRNRRPTRMTDSRERNSLFHAVKHGDVIRVRQLLQSGVHPEDPAQFRDGRTPLAVAAARGNTVLLRLLLEYGAKADAQALTAAAFKSHPEAVRLLLRAGVPATVQVSGYALLDFLRWGARRGKNARAVKQILREAGARESPDWYLRWRWYLLYGWRLDLRRMWWRLKPPRRSI